MINIDYACFLNHTGYSQAAIDMIMSLYHHGNYNIHISCFHKMPDKRSFSDEFYNTILSMVRATSHQNSIQIYQCIPSMHNHFGKKNNSIAFGVYETFDPPVGWVNSLNRMDAVICPSQFSYNQFAHSGVERPMFHIPHSINIDIWNEGVQSMYNRDKFTFLFVGSWRKRKGWPALIEAWFKEFRRKDDVQLVIKTDKFELAKKDIDIIKNNMGIGEDSAPILFENDIFNEYDLPRFYKSSHCLILPTLGEGFGLPPMQAMAIKVPVIVTDFGGCQEYANKENCTLLSPSGFMKHIMLDKIGQFKDKKWPRITSNEIQEAMRFVVNNEFIISEKANNAYDYIRNNFNYEKTANLFMNMIEEVYGVSILETQSV